MANVNFKNMFKYIMIFFTMTSGSILSKEELTMNSLNCCIDVSVGCESWDT